MFNTDFAPEQDSDEMPGYRPRRSRTMGQDPLSGAEPQVDAPAAAQGVAGAPPAVTQQANQASSSVNDPKAMAPQPSTMDPRLVQQLHDRDQAVTDFATKAAGAPAYQPKQHGTGYRILEGLTSMFSPAAADAIFEKPERKAYQAYEAQHQKDAQQLQALGMGAQATERELNLNREGVKDQAYIGYMNRRVSPGESKVIQRMGPDGKTAHQFQYNPETDTYDKDLGPIVEKPDNSMDDREFYNKNPQGWKQYHSQLAAMAATGPKSLTDFDKKIQLYKSDPDTYHAIFGHDDSGIMRIAEAAAKDPYTGAIDAGKMYEEYDKLRSKIRPAATTPGAGAPGATAGAPAAPLVKPVTHGAPIDKATAAKYLQASGGDRNAARAAAKKDGWGGF